MTFRREQPPEVRTAFHGEDGPLQGAAEMGLDALLTEDGMESWSEEGLGFEGRLG
jgi:hypothetical protein